MRIAQALDFLHTSKAAQFESLSDLIPNKLITTLLDEEGVATLRRRRMPMERLDLARIAQDAPEQVWFCGPEGMADALTRLLPDGHLHRELFRFR